MNDTTEAHLQFTTKKEVYESFVQESKLLHYGETVPTLAMFTFVEAEVFLDQGTKVISLSEVY